MNIPDYCEAITAWRVWDVFPNGLLAGQASKEPWPPYAPMRAVCAGINTQGGARDHLSKDGRLLPSPVLNCDCGIHALQTEAQALARVLGEDGGLPTWPLYGHGSKMVWGTVKLWGRIIIHESGYRAEYAYPGELRCEHPKLLEVVSQLYGVPCVLWEPPVGKEDDGDPYSFKNIPMSFGRRRMGAYPITPTNPPPPQPSFYYAASQAQAALYAKLFNDPTPTYIPAQPGFITPATDAQIKSFAGVVKAQPYQVRQQLRSRRGGKTQEWREILKEMVCQAKKITDDFERAL